MSAYRCTRGGRVEKFRTTYVNANKPKYIAKAANAKGWWTKETKCADEEAETGCTTNAVVYANGGYRRTRRSVGGRVEKFRAPYVNANKPKYVAKAANAKGWWTKETKCADEEAETGCVTEAVVYANGGRRRQTRRRY